MGKNTILSSPWDFTLYKTTDGKFVLKVMFIEGNYKIDIPRYFVINPADIGGIDKIKEIANEIRSEYKKYKTKEISKALFDRLSDNNPKP